MRTRPRNSLVVLAHQTRKHNSQTPSIALPLGEPLELGVLLHPRLLTRLVEKRVGHVVAASRLTTGLGFKNKVAARLLRYCLTWSTSQSYFDRDAMASAFLSSRMAAGAELASSRSIDLAVDQRYRRHRLLMHMY